jgi:hypothetical protein
MTKQQARKVHTLALRKGYRAEIHELEGWDPKEYGVNIWATLPTVDALAQSMFARCAFEAGDGVTSTSSFEFGYEFVAGLGRATLALAMQ